MKTLSDKENVKSSDEVRSEVLAEKAKKVREILQDLKRKKISPETAVERLKKL